MRRRGEKVAPAVHSTDYTDSTGYRTDIEVVGGELWLPSHRTELYSVRAKKNIAHIALGFRVAGGL
jgi:hypothetical protein